MALTNLEKYLIFDTTSQLLQQDILTNNYLLGSTVGASLRDMVLNQQRIQPLTQPYDEAITGTLRADAAAVRQNSRNVSEAASLMGTGASAVAQMYDALEQMEGIIDDLDSGDLTYSSSVANDFDALVAKITGLIESTDFNGINMLDSSQWGTEQIDSNGQVYIQAYKDGGFNLTFHPLDSLTIDGNTWSDFDGTALSADPDRQTQQDMVDDFLASISTFQEMYEGRQASLEFQVSELENQADLLEQAAQNRRQSTTTSSTSVEDLLLNLLLGSSSIVDEDA